MAISEVARRTRVEEEDGFQDTANIPQDEVVELLEAAGFDVLAGKTKIPITMTINEREQLESRLFIDYFAQKEDHIYLVKVAKERKPLEMTGSAVRDMLLALQPHLS